MNQDEIQKITLLEGCSFLPGSFARRFVKGMNSLLHDDPQGVLSDRQWYTLQTLFHSYGGQILRHNSLCLICKSLASNTPIIELVCPGCGNTVSLILRPKIKPGMEPACRNCGQFTWDKFVLRRIQ